MFGLILLILLIVGSASLCALYIGVRYHDLAMRACRKIARKLHLYKSPADPIWPILSAEERTKLDNAIKITLRLENVKIKSVELGADWSIKEKSDRLSNVSNNIISVSEYRIILTAISNKSLSSPINNEDKIRAKILTNILLEKCKEI